MNRSFLAAVATGVAACVFAGDLWAHGGQFRGPGGAVPPGMREPSDPTPPPPPPPSGAPPTTPSPTTPTPSAPTTPSPVPSTPPPSTPTVGGQPNTGKKSSLGFENWIFWYHNNKEDIENLKDAIYTRITSQNPLFQMGGRSDSNRSDATQATATKVESTIIPALLWAMNPKNAGHQDTESAAYIALAKVARDPTHIERLMKGLALAPSEAKRDQITQESAALALGLLRRADKANQFPAAELDKVRTFLFSIFEEKEYADRVRGFAALAIGLLGDQPTGSGEYSGDALQAAKATTGRIFDLLKEKYTNSDLSIGLLMALGLQPKPSITQEMRDTLAECSFKGKLFKDEAPDIVRAYAALNLGRVGTAENIKTLQNVLEARRGVDTNTARSAAIGLGVLGRLVDGADRVEVAKSLLSGIEKVKDDSAKNFGIISLAYLVIEDVKAKKTDVLNGAKVAEYLKQEASEGKYIQRPFGALALALIGREIGEQPEIEAYNTLRGDSLNILREGLKSQKLDKRGRAGFAVALGIIRDERSVKDLVALLADKKEDPELRGYSAIGLGLIGNATDDVKKAIQEALKDRISDELRQQTATGLGLLHDSSAVKLLLDELKEAQSQNVKGQVVLALAKIGDAQAVDPLVAILGVEVKDGKASALSGPKEQDLTRALACAGLGVIGDLESIPSLARISKDVNYRASTDLINEVLSIL
jgi:HEAT repeat protein